jgi:hypothetical protein
MMAATDKGRVTMAAGCKHGHGRTLCFECFRAGMEHTRARQDAWAQRALPFEAAPAALTTREIAHRRRMLEYLERTAQRRA